jgi:hypothetical protein
MTFRRSYDDPFRRDLPAACFGPAAPALAVASLAMSAIGTGLSVIGQANRAQAEAGQADYMAQVARNNQMLAERNATLAEQQGQVQEDRQRLKTAQLMGSQRAALAAQGGDVNAGSDLDILGDTARAGESDALTIRNNAAQQAFGYRQQAVAAGGQANLYSANAANTMANLPYGIGSSLLGGASSLAGRWAGYIGRNPDGSRYNLDTDYLRTAGDRDLNGYY